jgi:hypothetical protein
MRSWSGATGHPARYVDGTSAAVIVAKVPVNAGTGAVVVAGASGVVAGVAGVVVVATRVVATRVVDVVVVVVVVDDLAPDRTALSVPDDPHAAAVSIVIATNAHATR